MKYFNAAAIAFVAVVSFFALNYSAPTKEANVIFGSEARNITLNVKIADTDEARSRGLMFASKLDENEGMLFVFPDEQKRAFWMKNTLMPLDMIFIAANGTVVDVVENAQPCKEDPCPTYASGQAAKYVLEAKGGFAQRNGIAVGAAAASDIF